MKIAHLCLSNFFIDGFSYQENELVRQNVLDGHDVVVIASTESYDEYREITYVEPGTYMGAEGARIIRVPYSQWLPHKVMAKLRIHPGIFDLLQTEAPDVILFHSLCGWELLTVKAYKAAYPQVRVFADSHEDFNNSARSFISKHFLHGMYYRSVLHRALSSIEKVLCISVETINFVRDFYGVPADRIEFYPLGGFIYDGDEYMRVRAAGRSEYHLKDGEILFVQSGKMDGTKKVLESLRAFTKIDNPAIRLVLAGHLHEDIVGEANAIIEADPRIQFVGWKTADELRTLLCAADVYLQPGTQSATMQMSLCCRCAVILDNVPSHEPYMDGNGWLVGKDIGLDNAMMNASNDKAQLSDMALQSEKIAFRLLDYRKLAERLYQ
ncbi:MAG: glycosyltransferase family 4 protein [Sedimenticola sp.]|nr:glycosyltransferase family 4 protein [Sedimenticola sp.]